MLISFLMAGCVDQQRAHDERVATAWDLVLARPDDDNAMLQKRTALVHFLVVHPSEHPQGNEHSGLATQKIREIDARLAEQARLEAEEAERQALIGKLEPLLSGFLEFAWPSDTARRLDPDPHRPVILDHGDVRIRTRARWSFPSPKLNSSNDVFEDRAALDRALGTRFDRNQIDAAKLLWLINLAHVRPEDRVFATHTAAEVWPFFAPTVREQYRLARGVRASRAILEKDVLNAQNEFDADQDYTDTFEQLAQQPPNMLCLRFGLGMRCSGKHVSFWARRLVDGSLNPAIGAMEKTLKAMGDTPFLEETDAMVRAYEPIDQADYLETLEHVDPVEFTKGLAFPDKGTTLLRHNAQWHFGSQVELSEPQFSSYQDEGWTFLARALDGTTDRLHLGDLEIGSMPILTHANAEVRDGLLTMRQTPKQVAAAPDGEAVAVLGLQGELALYSLSSGSRVWTAEVPGSVHDLRWEGSKLFALREHRPAFPSSGPQTEICAVDAEGVTCTPTDVVEPRRLLRVDGGVVMHAGAWRQRALVLRSSGSTEPLRFAAPSGAVMHPNGKTFALQDQEEITFHTRPAPEDLDPPAVLASIRGNGRMDISPDGAWFVVEDAVRPLDARGLPGAVHRLKGAAAIREWATTAITDTHIAREEGNRVRVYDLASGEPVLTVVGDAPIALLPGGETLVTTSGRDLQIWKLPEQP